MRPSPIVHPAVDAPICPECQALDSTFFNPECKACQNELETMAHHGIGIASIFAILRQWIPQVCMHRKELARTQLVEWSYNLSSV